MSLDLSDISAQTHGMAKIPDPMPTEISEKAWQFLGRVARERREFIGLSQEELATYNGPGKSTVSKIERAAQPGYPPRTQQQLEKALGWDRGAVRSILLAAMEDYYGQGEESYAVDYIEAELPDLTVNDASAPAAGKASDLTDDELLAELTYRMKRYAQEKEVAGDGDDLAKKRAQLEADRKKLSEDRAKLDKASLFPEGRTDEPSGESEGDAP